MPTRPRSASLAAASLLLACGGVLAGAVTTTATAAPARELPCAVPQGVDAVLTSLDLGASWVDVTGSPQTLTLTALTAGTTGGPARGLDQVLVSLSSPSGRHAVEVPLWPSVDGAWVGTATIAAWTEGGSWVVESVDLVGADGQRQGYSYDDLRALGADRTLSVSSVADVTAPVLSALAVATDHVDVRRQARPVDVTVRALDAQSGVREAYVVASSGAQRAYALLTGAEGRLEGRLVLPRWEGSGTWTITQVRLTDAVGNDRTYGAEALRTLGLSAGLTVTGRHDRRAPQLSGVLRDIDVLDVSRGSAALGLTLHATDARAGVDAVVARLVGSGEESASAALQRVSGGPADGVWRGEVEIGRCEAVDGPWRVEITAYDAAGNAVTEQLGDVEVVGSEVAAGAVLAAGAVDGLAAAACESGDGAVLTCLTDQVRLTVASATRSLLPATR